MDGNEDDMVLCAFSGKWIGKGEALKICILMPEATEETQTLFADRAVFSKLLHSSVPLHPDLWGE
jgi:hypothetical protein